MRIFAFGLLSSACILVLSVSPGAAQRNSAAWTQQKQFGKYTEIPGATPVGAETCATCHSDQSKDFQHAFHAQQGIECEDCHGNASLHVAGGGDVTKIISFSKRPASAANGVCLSCHTHDDKVRSWPAGSHSANHLRCVDCHQIHPRALKTANEGQLNFQTATQGALAAEAMVPEANVVLRPLSQTNDACVRCHQTVEAQLSLPYHHPLREGKMSCVDCHDPHGGPAGDNLRTSNVNQLCLNCHAQYRGPFAYQHPPVSENCLYCHTSHGSPNTNLLQISVPALCLQCHAGHHNGAGLPLTDRCTNCHGSVHGTDTPTPSGGSRFVDKGPSDPQLRALTSPVAALAAAHSTMPASMLRPLTVHGSSYGFGAASAGLGILSAGALAPLSGGNIGGGSLWGGSGVPTETEAGAPSAAYSITPGAYRFVDGTGYLGRVGEYDSLQQSAGANAVTAYVSPQNHLTVVSWGTVLTGDDYQARSQVTAGERLQAGFNMRSFVQQQDNYPFYAFPVLDIPPGATTSPDTTTELIPAHSVFGVTRRLGNAYGRFKVPKIPVHLFVDGSWQARAGLSQLSYLDENTTPAVYAPNPTPPPALTNTTCGAQCHFQSGGSLNSQFQGVNYTTRDIDGGADVDLGQVRLTYQHRFSSFDDRLTFPTGVFTGPFTPENEGISSINPPKFGPAPPDIQAGNYFIDIPAPNQASTDSMALNWTASPKLIFNGNVSYTRLRNSFTGDPQNAFDSDETLNWRPLDRLRVIADYHQQNLINNFTPYYSMYGNVSYHEHWEGLRADYELPKGFDVEARYQRSGITRSNAFFWPQVYSIDNTDLQDVVPSSFSNTAGLVLRYHDRGHWSGRAGYEWTGTHDPGYLTIPQSNNRTFADIWFTPGQKLVFANDLSIIVQNAFPSIPLLRPDGSGATGDFQRRNRFYFETLSATLRMVPGWNLGLGYSYQQNNLTTYMAFQNDPAVGYVLDEPAVPYKQIAQAYWGESSYMIKQRLGLNLRLTFNSARSGFRPDLNPSDAPLLGNAGLIAGLVPGVAFDPVGFSAALSNVGFAANQISAVIVPEWIGQSRAYYLFPHKVEGGLIFYYGSYRDYWNPNLNGVLRTFNLYVGRSW